MKVFELEDLLVVQRTKGSTAGTYKATFEDLQNSLSLIWEYAGEAAPDAGDGIYLPAEVDDGSFSYTDSYVEAIADDGLDPDPLNTYDPALFYEGPVEDGCIIQPILPECGISGGIYA